jgi:hypothetical protein
VLRSGHRPFVPALLLASLLAWLPAASAFAQCTYNALANDVPVATPNVTTHYTFSGTSGFWGAVAVRPPAGSNHDLGVFANTAGSPTCVANQVGASVGASGVDFVVGDFRVGRNGPGPWYAKVSRVAGEGSGVVQLDRGGEEIIVDADPLVRNTDRVIDVFEVFLEGGVNYIVDFRPSLGVDAKVLIFRNPAANAYWADRSMRLLESSGPTNFPAPISDDYCVVVVNDDGGLSTYSLAIDQCQPPVDLASATPVSTSAPLRYHVDQDQPYWTAVGVRGAGPLEDWALTSYKTGRGALEPVCFKDLTATSNVVGSPVDFIVGDFTFNPLDAFFVRVNQVSGSQAAIVEWDGGADEIALGDIPLARATGPGDVLEIWDVFLTQGQTYTIFFEREGAADTHFLLFENGPQAPYWAGRSAAVLTGLTHASYAPAVTGYHAIAVVNDNGGIGTYNIGAYGSNVGVPGGTPRRASLDALAPNPSFGPTTISWSLPAAGTVAFDVLDVGGRRVARLEAQEAAAGPGRLAWDARGEHGRVAPGVYFVRMHFAGRRVGLEKLVVLP